MECALSTKRPSAVSRCSSAAVAVAVWCHCSVDKNQNCTNSEYKCSGVYFLILSRSALKCGEGSGRNKPGSFSPVLYVCSLPDRMIWPQWDLG